MTITRVENEGDRILAYGNRKHYYIICNRKSDIKPGDIIEYEPYGGNFGWFVSFVERASE